MDKPCANHKIAFHRMNEKLRRMFKNFRLCRTCGWYTADIIIHGDIGKESSTVNTTPAVGTGSNEANDSSPAAVPGKTMQVLPRNSYPRKLFFGPQGSSSSLSFQKPYRPPAYRIKQREEPALPVQEMQQGEGENSRGKV